MLVQENGKCLTIDCNRCHFQTPFASINFECLPVLNIRVDSREFSIKCSCKKTTENGANVTNIKHWKGKMWGLVGAWYQLIGRLALINESHAPTKANNKRVVPSQCQLHWNCTGTALKICYSKSTKIDTDTELWKRYESKLVLYCPGTALELHWNCTETALWLQDSELIQPKFHKVDDCTCSGTALELHWNCTGIAVVTRPKSGGSQNGLMKNSRVDSAKIPWSRWLDLLWNCTGTALWLAEPAEFRHGRQEQRMLVFQ